MPGVPPRRLNGKLASLPTSEPCASNGNSLAAQRSGRRPYNNVEYDRSLPIPIAISFLFRPKCFLNSLRKAQGVTLRPQLRTKAFAAAIRPNHVRRNAKGRWTLSRVQNAQAAGSSSKVDSCHGLKRNCPTQLPVLLGKISFYASYHVGLPSSHNADQLKRGHLIQVMVLVSCLGEASFVKPIAFSPSVL